MSALDVLFVGALAVLIVIMVSVRFGIIECNQASIINKLNTLIIQTATSQMDTSKGIGSPMIKDKK